MLTPLDLNLLTTLLQKNQDEGSEDDLKWMLENPEHSLPSGMVVRDLEEIQFTWDDFVRNWYFEDIEIPEPVVCAKPTVCNLSTAFCLCILK